MTVYRRSFILMLTGLSFAAFDASEISSADGEKQMYGLIGRMTAVEGKRDELSEILLKGLKGMPGNLSYVVANDPADANALWITEVWSDNNAHQASLSLPAVQEAIQKGRPLIASMERIAETTPLGGHGLQ